MNDTTKHTPGPWEAKPDSDLAAFEYEVYSRAVMVATIHWLNDDDELEANAELIAAAPDLLAAGLHAEQALDMMYRIALENEKHSMAEGIKVALNELSAALDKATGGTRVNP